MAYSKLHSSIVNSSLWTEPDPVRIIFITLLAMCDQDGVVFGTIGGLSRLANIDPDDIETSWATLMSPDTDSSDAIRAPENEGRRIERVSGGFRLLNFAYYRGLRNDDDRRDQNREAQARFRSKQSKPASSKVSRDKPLKAHTEAEAEAEADTKAKKEEKERVARFIPPTLDQVLKIGSEIELSEIECKKLHSFYESKGWLVGKQRMKSLKAAMNGWKLRSIQPEGEKSQLQNLENELWEVEGRMFEKTGDELSQSIKRRDELNKLIGTIKSNL